MNGAAAPGETPLARCGFAALVGRPNVGKSTLLNALLGRKLSIVTPKPQTTRNRIQGVLTRPGLQIAFVDLPGLHSDQKRAINRYMNRTALAALGESDVNLLVVEALRWTDEDERTLARVLRAGRPIVLVINKVDRVQPKSRLLPYIESLRSKAGFAEIVPVSATRPQSLARLPETIAAHLPESPLMFPPDQVTDLSERFLAAEIIREKLMLRLRDEIPYGLAVEIEEFRELEEEPGKRLVRAVIWVERMGQKAIVIGKGGEQLKAVGRAARLELVRALGGPVHVELWVKVKEDWSDSESALRRFGFVM